MGGGAGFFWGLFVIMLATSLIVGQAAAFIKLLFAPTR